MPKDPIRVGSTVDVVCLSGPKIGTGEDALVTAITPDEIHCGGRRFWVKGWIREDRHSSWKPAAEEP